MGFVEAYGAFDAEQAISYLADDADISGMMASVGARGEGTPASNFDCSSPCSKPRVTSRCSTPARKRAARPLAPV